MSLDGDRVIFSARRSHGGDGWQNYTWSRECGLHAAKCLEAGDLDGFHEWTRKGQGPRPKSETPGRVLRIGDTRPNPPESPE